MLSIVMPFYKKDIEFNYVFPYFNLDILNQYPQIELLLIIDAPESYQLALETVQGLVKNKRINFSLKIILNEVTHEWRPPCTAINVGIKNATHNTILVVSPETVFFSNSLPRLLQGCSPKNFSIGLIRFVYLSEPTYIEPAQLLLSANASGFTPYGSIMFTKEQAERVGGYDEGFTKWGGDDDDFRQRLKKAGYTQTTTLATFIHINLIRHRVNGSPSRTEELEDETMANKINTINARDSFEANLGIYGQAYHRIIFEHSSDLCSQSK